MAGGGQKVDGIGHEVSGFSQGNVKVNSKPVASEGFIKQ
jgi:hypothetical protein